MELWSQKVRKETQNALNNNFMSNLHLKIKYQSLDRLAKIASDIRLK